MPRHNNAATTPTATLHDTLLKAGLDSKIAALLDDMPRREIDVDPRRPFRQPGAPRDEVIFVASGLLSKFKTDDSGRRQIVALRFAGEGVLPREGGADYGLQAIVPSRLLVGKASDFDPIVEKHTELQKFFIRLIQRETSIGYEWLVNCGRRDSTARVGHLLCETAARMGTKDNPNFANPFTQQQIADITGQTSVNVNRVLADLERQGVIQRNGRELTINDWNELRRIAGFQPNYLR